MLPLPPATAYIKSETRTFVPMQPTKDDQKIKTIYPIAWCALLVMPIIILYNGFKHHNFLVVVASGLAICGFSALIVIAIRHNRKIAKSRNPK